MAVIKKNGVVVRLYGRPSNFIVCLPQPLVALMPHPGALKVECGWRVDM